MTESKLDPDKLQLRAPPPRVTRLSRKAIVATAGVVAALILGTTLWSLRSVRPLFSDTPAELHNVDRVSRAEGLDQLPADYSKIPSPKALEPSPPIPVLGPPLPGDLGNAIVQRLGDPDRGIPGLGAQAVKPDPATDAARVERIAREREIEDAAKAPLFFRANGGATQTSSGHATVGPAVATQPLNASAPADDSATPAVSQASSDEKRQLLAERSNSATMSTHRLQMPASPYQLMAGAVISAALITGIDSDLPGQVLASVTEPVYDSQTGQHVLIPQGSRLIGEYDSQVAFGQRRVLLVWNRLILPDASSISLDRLSGVDARGLAGLEDGVDRHWRELLAGAALSTLIGIGAELAAPDRNTGQGQVIVATRQSVQDSVNQVGQDLSRKNVNIQPTLTIRPGYPLRVIVSKDLALRPYEPLFVGRERS